VRQLGDLADELDTGRAGADSNASRIWSRRCRASSMVFMPGAYSAKSSRPK
jgi:hypothetical protein